jgi:plasmid stabilization system protein ParE
MTWRVLVRPAASKDLADARDWYEKRRPGLGDEFLASVADALVRLEQLAEKFPHYYLDFRRILTAKFPYKIFYRIEGDVAIVFRVLHSTADHTRRLK